MMISQRYHRLAAWLLFAMSCLLLSSAPGCVSFAPLAPNPAFGMKSASPLNLSSGGEEDSAGGLFGSFMKKATSAFSQDKDTSEPERLFDISVKGVKIGGLRFVLGLHFMGQQGTPEKGTWIANQGEGGVIDMFYRDNTGVFTVTLTDNTISVDRYGPQPSLAYRLQESLQLHALLDELETLATGNEEEVKEENRLLKFSDSDAIERARSTLPARAA